MQIKVAEVAFWHSNNQEMMRQISEGQLLLTALLTGARCKQAGQTMSVNRGCADTTGYCFTDMLTCADELLQVMLHQGLMYLSSPTLLPVKHESWQITL